MDINNIVISVSGTCGTNLEGVFDTDGLLIIRGKGNMEDYSAKKPAPWTPYRELIRKLVIEEGVTGVGDYAFFMCLFLKHADISSTLKDIGFSSFLCCHNLKHVKFAQGSQLEYIGDFAFKYCSSLAEIEIPGSVTSIGSCAFEYCENLKEVTLGSDSKLEQVGDYAFCDCCSLELVEMPSNLKEIGEDIFLGSGNFISVPVI